ncbi:hypothetical protein [Kaarinaea lacus]
MTVSSSDVDVVDNRTLRINSAYYRVPGILYAGIVTKKALGIAQIFNKSGEQSWHQY